MGSDVFLLGAGFSKAVSPHMPLLDELRRDSDRLEGDWPRGLLRSMNFEELLTYLSQNQPWLSSARNLRNRAAFLDFSQSIADRVVSEEGKVLAAPPPDWFPALIERLHQDQAKVISLNYDTLIEHAWTEFLRQGSPQHEITESHASLYAVPIPSALARTQMVLGPNLGVETLRLLKLHGSTNWCYSGSEMASGEEIYDIGLVPGWRNVPLRQDARAAAIDKVPLLVPPTLGKSPFFVNETIRSLWRVAFSTLRESDRLFALGYSLPETDNNMLGLLRTSLGGDHQSVHVVNVNVEAGTRYQRLLDVVTKVDVTYAASGISAFVNEYLND